LAKPGEPKPAFEKRLAQLKVNHHAFKAYPTVFWDIAGEQGHPLRTTVSELGPILMGRLLNLNATQQSVLELAFQIADAQGYLLVELEDIQALLTHLSTEGKAYEAEFGALPKASLGAIQRQLSALAGQGGEAFFGEPALDLPSWLQSADDGRGRIHVLRADALIQQPRLYAAVMLWLLSEWYEQLPEAGDLTQPKLVLMLDEAHLLFEDAPEILLDKITQVARLIRSKGVGVFFITQNPSDIPETVRGQLGNRVLHALRAFSPKDQKVIRALAQSLPSNPALGDADTLETKLTTLGIGEALVSTLTNNGAPTPTQHALILPPCSYVGPLTPQERQAVIARSPFAGRYDTRIDRDSAYEQLQQRVAQTLAPVDAPEKAKPREARQQASGVELMFKNVMRSVGSELGRQMTRSILGSLGLSTTQRRRRR
ncbi:MAG: helicase HerA-like domain-containing protein, partial [Vampirovibrionales bacterium]|nr:helicase HerA-like domain-containing protein [Vampirovibrionales bacterium]